MCSLQSGLTWLNEMVGSVFVECGAFFGSRFRDFIYFGCDVDVSMFDVRALWITTTPCSIYGYSGAPIFVVIIMISSVLNVRAFLKRLPVKLRWYS